MADESGAALLRMVRFRGVQQDAERLRAPLEQDPYEALSRTIHMGDARTAKRALVSWAKAEIRELKERHASRYEWSCVRATYYEFLAKINGRQTVMATELGHYSQNVAPDFGKVTYRFHDWATPSLLKRVFNEGNELVIQGHMGTGKTHLAVLFMERLLGLSGSKYQVITNVSGVKDKTGRYRDRIHVVSRLSEILGIWAKLPAETHIFLVLDEPESSLRGGSTKSVKTFQDFRHMLRKLGIAKAEIWHNESEQYKSLREEKSEQLYRVMTERKGSFSFTYQFRNETVTQDVQEVPEVAVLTFATRGMASIDVDVNMQSLISHISKLYEVADMKKAVREALTQPRFYHAEFRDEGEVRRSEAAAQDKEDRERVAAILAKPERFLNRAGPGFHVASIRKAFACTNREADYAAMKAWEHIAKEAASKGRRPPRLARQKAEAVEAIALQEVRQDPKRFKTARGFDAELIRRTFDLTHRGATFVARQAARGDK